MLNYEPIKNEFDTVYGMVTITPENINLVPKQYLDEYTYCFNVCCKLTLTGIVFQVQIVASFKDEIWTLIKLNNYIVKFTDKYVEIHNLIYEQIIPRLKMFDNIFVRDYLTIKQDLFFNGEKITIRKMRKTDTTATCKIIFTKSEKELELKNLEAIFKIDNTNFDQPKFVLDVFIYEERNIHLCEYIDKYGTQLRMFLNTNINYVRVM